jgi:hypothetical protein
MPPVFKALATIIVWILFIAGCLIILANLALVWRFNGSWEYLAVGIASLVLSVVVMKIRKSL